MWEYGKRAAKKGYICCKRRGKNYLLVLSQLIAIGGNYFY
jgi:hypothetical protein